MRSTMSTIMDSASAKSCASSAGLPNTKLIWLALRNITTDRGRAAKVWKEAMNQFAILYEDRFTK